jgi:hypothetical protein
VTRLFLYLLGTTMKLRIVQEGFETYTGQMGVVFFESGLSVGDVSQMDATRMSAVMKFEWEDRSASNVAQIYLDNMHTPAPLFAEDAPAALETQKTVVVEKIAAYTEDQLAAIADEKGIAGLRAIAEPLEIKGNSIVGLIEAIQRAAVAPAKKAE